MKKYLKFFFSYLIKMLLVCLIFFLLLYYSGALIKSEPPLTGMHKAVQENNFEKVNQLIKSGRNINKQTKSGMTPLHIFATLKDLKANIEIAVLLVNSGADISIKNKAGQTAVKLAEEKGNYYLAKYLYKAMTLQKINGKKTSVPGYYFDSMNKLEKD